MAFFTLQAGVVKRGDAFQPFFYFLFHLQRFHKSVNGVPGDFTVLAGQAFQRLVGIGISFFSQDGLYGLGHHGPVFIKVVVNGRRENELVQTGGVLSKAIPLWTGMHDLTSPPHWNKDGTVTIRQDYPLPMTILGLSPELSIGRG